MTIELIDGVIKNKLPALPFIHCQSTFFVPIEGENHLGVQFFIYENKRKFRLGLKGRPNTEGAAGYFMANGADGNFMDSEIHLLTELIGAGYVAHEIQHWIQWWIAKNNLKPVDGDNETVCELAECMTRNFWYKFYELYREIKSEVVKDGAKEK
jgi:hypothetical protein